MRDIIDTVNKLLEGDVVSLKQHKSDKAIGAYADAIGGIFRGELNFFANGKFSCFAVSYIESGFNPKFAPMISMDVNFRDYRLSPEARAIKDNLKNQRFKIEPAIRWAKGSMPKENANQDRFGPFARKTLDLNTAKEIFADREHSHYGAYQPSRSGFRTAHENNWDENGVGFNIMVGGMDNRRGDKYGNDYREEYHIIDNDKDMKEVVDMYALIQRAHLKSV